jgi:ribosome-binding ATPase YchF (GTP1/OBG family)
MIAVLEDAEMKVGLVGYSGSGKSTVFEWLTGVKPDPGKAQHGQTGVTRVPDSRLTWLGEMFQPKKTTFTSLELLDTPGLLPTERRDNPRRLGILRESGGLLVVLGGYSEGDLAGQLTRFRGELIFADLEIVTNRIDKLQAQLKKPRPAKEKEPDQLELDLLGRIVKVLEAEQSPATLGLKPEEEKAIRSFQLLTLKPEQVLVNIGDDRIGQPLPADLLALAPTALQAPARFELELEELPEDERQVFVKDFLTDKGVPGLARESTIRAVFAAMAQQVFFTVGYDECRSWGIPRGGDAVTAAAQVHTDLAKNFVRAEVLPYEDFRKVYGNFKGRVGEKMAEARHAGLLRLEGKTYVVQDGDIVHIL